MRKENLYPRPGSGPCSLHPWSKTLALEASPVTELREAVDSFKTTVETTLVGQDEKIDGVEERIADVEVKATALDKWLAEVEKNLEARRIVGYGGTSVVDDALKQAIPERYRGAAELAARHGKKDPWKVAAFVTWMKLAFKLQAGSRLERNDDPAEMREALARIEESFGYAEKAAMTGETAATGGYTVPTPLEAEVLRQIVDGGVLRGRVRQMAMTAFTHNIPNLATGVVATIIAEAGSIAEDEPTFGQSQLIAKMFAARGLASVQALNDSAIGLFDLWLTLATESIAGIEDLEALEGAANFTGLIGEANVNEITNGANGATPSWAKYVAQKWKAGKRSTRRRSLGCAWYCHPFVAAETEGLLDSNGNPIWRDAHTVMTLETQQDPGVSDADGFLMGYPLYTTEQINQTRTVGTSSDTGNVYFGPFGKSMIFGDLLGLTFGVSEHVAWNTAQVGVRLLKRTAILVGVGADFTKQTGVRAVTPA